MAAPARPAAARPQLRKLYGQLVASLVRPPRAEYALSDLDAAAIGAGAGVPPRVRRTDFEVVSGSGARLRCSKWATARARPSAVVIYCHANSSSRVGVVRSAVLATVASIDATLVAFDFAGCGQSEGDYVTLGIHEQADVHAVIRSVVAADAGARIVLWGRSMGAVAAALCCDAYGEPSVVGLVLDSPFYSMKRIVDGVSKQIAPRAPHCLVACLVCALRRSARDKCGVDVFRVDTAAAAARADRPALIIGGQFDTLSPPASHAVPLSEEWGRRPRVGVAATRSLAELVLFDGDHNSVRPVWVYDTTRRFLRDALAAAPAAPAALPPPSGAPQPRPAPPERPLPAGWAAARDAQSGDEYYFRAHETTWLRPRDDPPGKHQRRNAEPTDAFVPKGRPPAS
ncbi:Alpha/Beta hydrolase protein [Pelagophyceae sp. CCMP2097]|nr:Alpha/Beta hydrolase protein [Pelagophyceae sp. CCMP2097]